MPNKTQQVHVEYRSTSFLRHMFHRHDKDCCWIFTARIYAMNASVYSAFRIIASFCHCNDTSWKGKEDCFPVWNADQIASSAFICLQERIVWRENQDSSTRKTHIFDIRRVCTRRGATVFWCEKDTLQNFLLWIIVNDMETPFEFLPKFVTALEVS
jgi:hypothetical protein